VTLVTSVPHKKRPTPRSKKSVNTVPPEALMGPELEACRTAYDSAKLLLRGSALLVTPVPTTIEVRVQLKPCKSGEKIPLAEIKKLCRILDGQNPGKYRLADG
jgi:hypothetical protein